MRRRLRLPSSSDEEDDDQRPQTLTPPNPPDPPPAPPNPPLEISDDDFVDVPDDLSPISPPTAPAHPAGTPTDNDGASSVPRLGLDGSLRPIDEFLRRLGLWLRPEWLGSCVASLTGSGSGFEGLDVAGKARRCFEQFLLSDMNRSGAGVLPENVHGMHRAELEGPFVLQGFTEGLRRSKLWRTSRKTSACCLLGITMFSGIQSPFDALAGPDLSRCLQTPELLIPESLQTAISDYSQALVVADLDPSTAKLAIGITGPFLSAFGFLFIARIVMSWYPKLPVGKFPYVIAYAPTEPLLRITRKLIPPLGGVDVTPVVWFGLISFLNEILVGPQGLL